MTAGSSVPEAARAADEPRDIKWAKALKPFHTWVASDGDVSGGYYSAMDLAVVGMALADAEVAAAVAEERRDGDANLAEAFNLGCREGSLTTMRALGVEVLSQRSANVTDAIDVQCVNPYLTPDAERFMDEFSRLVTENDRLTSAVAEERATTGRALEQVQGGIEELRKVWEFARDPQRQPPHRNSPAGEKYYAAQAAFDRCLRGLDVLAALASPGEAVEPYAITALRGLVERLRQMEPQVFDSTDVADLIETQLVQTGPPGPPSPPAASPGEES